MDEETRKLLDLADNCAISGKWLRFETNEGPRYLAPEDLKASIERGEDQLSPAEYAEVSPEEEMERAAQALMAANKWLSVILSKLTGRVIDGGDTPRV